MTSPNKLIADGLRKRLKGVVRADEPMSRHTSFAVGGPADIYAEPADTGDIAILLAEAQRLELSWTVVGDGQNLLVSDKGIRGLVIRLGRPMAYINIEGTRMVAGAAAKLPKAVDAAVESGLAGLEGCAGVPGSVGGAIVMNAGTRAGWIGDVTERVRVVHADGTVQDLGRGQLDFSYKSTLFQKGDRIISEAEFVLKPGVRQELASFVQKQKRQRRMTQPIVGKSAGCMFKNPPDSHAGYLIEISGGKGMREGDAEVSPIHANFLMNMGSASAQQIRALAEQVRELVKAKQGIVLEYEVRQVGDWQGIE